MKVNEITRVLDFLGIDYGFNNSHDILYVMTWGDEDISCMILDNGTVTTEEQYQIIEDIRKHRQEIKSLQARLKDMKANLE